MSRAASAEPGVRPAMTLDDQLTGARIELKYLLPESALADIVAALDARMVPHRFQGEGANPLPYAQHFITTVYLDTPSRAHFRGAKLDAEHNVKVRLREYYDVHPSLAELATEDEQILHHRPWIWLEVKRREGVVTTKRRLRLPKKAIGFLFSEQMDAASLPEDVCEQLAELCPELPWTSSRAPQEGTGGERLRPDCLANYQRLSWQDAAAHLRITLDLDVAFFQPTEELWQQERALVRHALGPELGRPVAGILELKHHGQLPDWVVTLLERSTPSPHSKFLLASQAVHGD